MTQTSINDIPPLPSGFLRQMEAQLKEQFPLFLASYDKPSLRALRLRGDVDQSAVQPFLGAPVPWAANAYYIRDDAAPGAHPLHEAGAYYIQDASAMAPALALSPKPCDTVLDLCAAPGGKATQLAAMMQGKGCLVANEPHPARAKILSRNIERMGIPHAAVTNTLPEVLQAKWPERFDCILVDAPCSGEGMFRKDPAARLEWSMDSPERCAKRQLSILESAARMLKPGGRMVYSTCTFNETENERVILAFLDTHRDFELLPFTLPGLPPAGNGMLRLWPHIILGEGHFVALMRKRGDLLPSAKRPQTPCKEEQFVRSALQEVTAYEPHEVVFWKGSAVCPPDVDLNFDALPLLRLGLHLGTFKGKQFIPDHALALAAEAKRQLPIDESLARIFLHGDVLPASSDVKGWLSPQLYGFQLGWGKASDGQIKNHYPKGLRK